MSTLQSLADTTWMLITHPLAPWVYARIAVDLVLLPLAIWRGGWPERYGVALNFTNLMAGNFWTLARTVVDLPSSGHLHAATDSAFLLAWCVLIARTRLVWPLFAAAALLLCLLTQLAATVGPNPGTLALWDATHIWGWMGAVALAWGVAVKCVRLSSGAASGQA